MSDTRDTPTTEHRSARPRLDPGARTNGPSAPPSIGTLLKTLSRQSTTLLREEVALARAELDEKLDVFRANALRITIGAGLLIGAVLLVVVALNRGLTAVLADAISLGVAVWLSPLILAAVAGGAAWALIKGSLASLREEGVVPRETIETLKDDRDWAEGRIRA